MLDADVIFLMSTDNSLNQLEGVFYNVGMVPELEKQYASHPLKTGMEEPQLVLGIKEETGT